MSAGSKPSNLKSEGPAPAILDDNGKKRYFICHGGPPVSKDGVTLEEVAKIERCVFFLFIFLAPLLFLLVPFSSACRILEKADNRYGRQPGHEGLMCEVRLSRLIPLFIYSC
jgi:hypothetical protein